ncbi:MAG: N-acetyltransferase [Paenibacillus sp.]|jgi:ribosomal protein S18 acetylase RimI-like enzyme|nr:N-acetyltransferase [Paenibacillus sp.]
MKVQMATIDDLGEWLHVASQVEHLFGPMISDPAFLEALSKNVQRGSALCVREEDGPPGTPLMGGMLYSVSKAPVYQIGWLAVSEKWRGNGVASALIRHVVERIVAPAELIVTTFGEDNIAGRPARRLYERVGFVPAEMAPNGPEGGTRQIFRCHL